MEREPQVESTETLWVNYGKLLMLMELRDTVRPDWVGYGVQVWVDRKIKELSPSDSNQMEIEHGL